MAGPRVLQLLFLLLAALVAAARAESPGDPQVGVLQEVDVSDKDVQRMRDFALSVYNQDHNDVYLGKAVRVVRARKQVVAGENFLLDIEISHTTCTKSQPHSEDCPLNEDPDEQRDVLCSFEIFSVPWQDTVSMTEYSCEEKLGSA